MVCVVPTYRPDDASKSAIQDLSTTVPVLVTDDGSPCTFDRRLSSIGTTSGVRVIRHKTNRGIGRGLNEGLTFAQDSGARWLLSVDQDSRLPYGYIEHLVGVADSLLDDDIRIGVAGALHVNDASGDFTYPTTPSQDPLQPYPETAELIASGSLWNVAALVEVGGFRSDLGMDAVDAAACLSLREAGFRVVTVPGITFEHRIGAGERSQIIGRSVLRTGHSRTRRQQILANRLRLFPREWRQSPLQAIRTVRRAGVNAILGGTSEFQPKDGEPPGSVPV